MSDNPRKNLHVPLPQELHVALRRQSERLNTPATALAREAIEDWLARRRRAEIEEQIRQYRQAVAGTEDDLAEDLAAAGEEELRKVEELSGATSTWPN
jgi:predicted transcriptional regulator